MNRIKATIIITIIKDEINGAEKIAIRRDGRVTEVYAREGVLFAEVWNTLAYDGEVAGGCASATLAEGEGEEQAFALARAVLFL